MLPPQPDENEREPDYIIYPEIVFDALDGKPVPPGMGSAVFEPIAMLPEVVFDASDPDDTAPGFRATT